MIPLSLGQIIVAYAATFVVALFLLSLVRHLWGLRIERRARRRQIQCALCGVIYESADSSEALPRCPACAHPNERVSSPGI